jgi:hypothetical protein
MEYNHALRKQFIAEKHREIRKIRKEAGERKERTMLF